jgi:hypothetical protein
VDVELLESPHLFTVEEYMSLDIEARTELLGGVIYDVSPRNEPHRLAVRTLTRVLARGLGEEYTLQVQDAVAVPGWKGHDAPEVDVAILKRRAYRPGPMAADAVACIEVSHKTYAVDRKYKIPLYVTAGIPSYIVNISRRRVEFYATVDDLKFKHGRIVSDGGSFEILEVTIDPATLFEAPGASDGV